MMHRSSKHHTYADHFRAIQSYSHSAIQSYSHTAIQSGTANQALAVRIAVRIALTIITQQYIPWLDVSVHDASVVQVQQGQTDLRHPLHDTALWHPGAALGARLHRLSQVTRLAIMHDEEKFSTEGIMLCGMRGGGAIDTIRKSRGMLTHTVHTVHTVHSECIYFY